MHFAFDEQQLEFRSQLRSLADKMCRPEALRTSWGSDLGWSAERWAALADLGVLGVTVPEGYGGLGLGLVDLVLLLEEAGRSGIPEPLIDTTALAVPLLAAAVGPAAETLRSYWMPRVVQGDAVLTVADPALQGLVTAGAHLALVHHRSALYAVMPGGADAVQVRSIDGSRRMVRVDASGPDATLVAPPELATALFDHLSASAALATAAVLIGVADRLIAMGAQYAGQRQQFGRPIGSFQAVKHHLAGALVRLEFARPLVYRAALSIDEQVAGASCHSSMAKAAASDAASSAARVALQVHGAIGYTWEHDLHMWMKRAWALAAAWGDAAEHRARVLRLMAGAAPDGT